MTTNANEHFRQYLGTCEADGSYAIRLRTHKGQRYANAPIIASFPTYALMTQSWDMCTDAEGMINVFGTD